MEWGSFGGSVSGTVEESGGAVGAEEGAGCGVDVVDGKGAVAGCDGIDVVALHGGFGECLRFGENACLGVSEAAFESVDGALKFMGG